MNFLKLCASIVLYIVLIYLFYELSIFIGSYMSTSLENDIANKYAITRLIPNMQELSKGTLKNKGLANPYRVLYNILPTSNYESIIKSDEYKDYKLKNIIMNLIAIIILVYLMHSYKLFKMS